MVDSQASGEPNQEVWLKPWCRAWAEGLIAKYHFASPALRVEQAYVVVGVDSIWQVAANLQADTPPEDVAGMLRGN